MDVKKELNKTWKRWRTLNLYFIISGWFVLIAGIAAAFCFFMDSLGNGSGNLLAATVPIVLFSVGFFIGITLIITKPLSKKISRIKKYAFYMSDCYEAMSERDSMIVESEASDAFKSVLSLALGEVHYGKTCFYATGVERAGIFYIKYPVILKYENITSVQRLFSPLTSSRPDPELIVTDSGRNNYTLLCLSQPAEDCVSKLTALSQGISENIKETPNTVSKKLISWKTILKNILIACIIVFFLVFGMSRIANHVNTVLGEKWVAPVILGSTILLMALYAAVMVLYSLLNIKKLMRTLSEIKEPDERIRKLEELLANGSNKNRLMCLNLLSNTYYEKGDYEKALTIIREAAVTQQAGNVIHFGSKFTIYDILKLNEVIYLTMLGRFEEAEEILDRYDESRFKNVNARYNINITKAQLAIGKSDPNTAREYLRQAISLPVKFSTESKTNTHCYQLLMEAECDILEHDAATALAKLDYIIAHCTWPHNVKRAVDLKDAIQADE